MSYKLYFAPGACSFVPHCLLQASGVEFEPVMIKLHKSEQSSAEYRAINPRGQVPVLITDGIVLTQIVAICSYLNDQFESAQFLPKDSLKRAKALETLAWMNNTVHPMFTHFFMPGKFTDDPQAQAAIKAHATVQYHQLLLEIQSLLNSSSPWFSGEHFGPLDAYSLTLLRWGGFLGVDPHSLPALWSHVQRVAQLPAVVKVIERERLQLNMFAPSSGQTA
jgi:glutathione S-transferase